MDLNIQDTVGSATATAGLVIACAITLSMVSTKFIAAFERYRALTGEYRAGSNGQRKHSLRDQIQMYHRRCRYMRLASMCMLAGELAFLLAIVGAGVGVNVPWLAPKVIVGGGMLLGLSLLSIGVFIDLLETRITRRVLDSEVCDLDRSGARDGG